MVSGPMEYAPSAAAANYLFAPNQPMDASFDFGVTPTTVGSFGGGGVGNFGYAPHALPGMVGNESSLSSSDFWKDGLGLGFGLGGGSGADFPMTGTPSGTGRGLNSDNSLGEAGALNGTSSSNLQAAGGGSAFAGGLDFNTSVYDFWDLSTPQTTSHVPLSNQPGYMVGDGQGGGGSSSGFDWGNQSLGASGAVANGGGENRRAAEVMADQLMSSGW